MKRCTKCRETKALEDFPRDKTRKDGKGNKCKLCNRAVAAKQRQDHREELTEYHKQYREENRERRRKYDRQYRRENQEQRADYFRVWAKVNADKTRLSAAKYRALKAKATVVPFAEQDLHQIWGDSPRCYYCGGEFGHWDHVYPLAKGGEHSPANLVPSCVSCNTSKGAKFVDEWMPTRTRQ